MLVNSAKRIIIFMLSKFFEEPNEKKKKLYIKEVIDTDNWLYVFCYKRPNDYSK